ncbi:MAG TPA: FimV/HubP family polar landmark protein [Steroidobacteraceae bacterium]|nr:FimV/HubP family polar landmark protein [Steroidobacteraceae bacterium]
MPDSILEWTMSNGKNPLMLMMAMTVPGAAHALGLGDIHVTSGLNERLSADIDIVGATSVELTGLRASIATRDLFARYGFDRPAFLSSMTFKVGKDAQGHPVLSMTSTDSFNEPVVNLLVDVQWGNGQLVREYTLLLDPVGFAPVPRQAASGATQPAAPSDTRAAEPTDSDDGTASSAPAAETAAASGGAAVATQDDTGGHADPAARSMTHIKVGPRATLRGIAWRIGERTESDLQRMMIAIFRANPGAFEGNINILHLGAVLTIPTDDQIESISRADAKREVHEQMVAWRAAAPERAAKFAARAAAARAESHAAAEPTAAPGAAAASAAAAVTRSSAAPGSTAASASVTAGAAATVAAGTTAARIASPGTASPGPAADSTPAPGNETAQALNQRIQSLEQELRDLKGTLDQERDQLAAMQAYAARAELAKAVAQQNATAHAAAPTRRTAPAADAKAEAAGGAQPSRHGLALPVIGGLGLLGAALAGIYMRMRRRSESEAPIGGRVDLAPPPAGQLEPVQTRRTAPPPSERAYEVVETVPVRALSADPALEPTSKLRQLGLDQASLEDSQRVQAILEGTGDDPTNRLPAMTEDSVSRYSYGGQADPSHEPTVRMRAEDAMSGRADPTVKLQPLNANPELSLSMSSERSLSDLHMSDVDMTSQHHVHMPSALNENPSFKERRSNPADVLKKAIEREPDRDDLRMKLLELYYSNASTNAQEFLEVAQKFTDQRGTMPSDQWEKIAAMGRQLAGQNPIFGPPEAAPAPAEAKEEPKEKPAGGGDSKIAYLRR